MFSCEERIVASVPPSFSQVASAISQVTCAAWVQ